MITRGPRDENEQAAVDAGRAPLGFLPSPGSRPDAAPWDVAYPTPQLIAQSELFSKEAYALRKSITEDTATLARCQSRLAAIHTELARRAEEVL